MEPGVAIAIGVAWFLLNLFGKRKTPGPGSRPPVVRLPPTGGGDPTQREGARLQSVLREIGKALEQSSGPRGRTTAVRLPSAEEVEDRTSLETFPEVRSLETEVRRAPRQVVDLDDEAEKVATWRTAAAEGNRRALRLSDHVAFDERIRKEAAVATAAQGANVLRLRNAIIWSEILGPPISMRDTDGC